MTGGGHFQFFDCISVNLRHTGNLKVVLFRLSYVPVIIVNSFYVSSIRFEGRGGGTEKAGQIWFFLFGRALVTSYEQYTSGDNFIKSTKDDSINCGKDFSVLAFLILQ